MRPSPRIRSRSTPEHAAERPVAGHELIAARERERGKAPRAKHSSRFRWAVAGLFVLALCALGGALALVSTGHRSSGAGGDWSSFSPQDSGLAGAQEIADYVAPYYRATASDQLAVVTA